MPDKIINSTSQRKPKNTLFLVPMSVFIALASFNSIMPMTTAASDMADKNADERVSKKTQNN